MPKTDREKIELLFRHFEAEIQLIHDKLIRLVTDVNQVFNNIDKLKMNYAQAKANHRK
jgi:hypothetical protein